MSQTIAASGVGRVVLAALLALGIAAGVAGTVAGSADARPCQNCPLEGPPHPDINDGP
jgi:hypothetical protein